MAEEELKGSNKELESASAPNSPLQDTEALIDPTAPSIPAQESIEDPVGSEPEQLAQESSVVPPLQPSTEALPPIEDDGFDDDDDGFGDFDAEPIGGGGVTGGMEDDFGDFGDFDQGSSLVLPATDQADLFDDDEEEELEPQIVTPPSAAPAPIRIVSQQPSFQLCSPPPLLFANTSPPFYQPTFSPKGDDLFYQISEILGPVYPGTIDTTLIMGPEEIRQVEGIAQVLVDEERSVISIIVYLGII